MKDVHIAKQTWGDGRKTTYDHVMLTLKEKYRILWAAFVEVELECKLIRRNSWFLDYLAT